MCECVTTCPHCGAPRAHCLSSRTCLLGSVEIPTGQISDAGHAIFEPYRRADTTAGLAIRNPAADEPWYLDVVAVGEPDADGVVTLATLQGPVRVIRDWPCAPRTVAEDDLGIVLTIEEELRWERKQP